MNAMASQITSLTIVYSTVYSRRRSKKTAKPGVTGPCAGNSPVAGEFPAQRASNAENVYIWRPHHGKRMQLSSCSFPYWFMGCNMHGCSSDVADIWNHAGYLMTATWVPLKPTGVMWNCRQLKLCLLVVLAGSRLYGDAGDKNIGLAYFSWAKWWLLNIQKDEIQLFHLST